jgi:hypothetical protein
MVCVNQAGNVDSSLVCVANSNPLNQPKVGDGKCVTLTERCSQITDSTEGVSIGTHDNLCRPLSVAGVGRCGWYDEYWNQLFKPDRCVWRPALKCPANWHTVSCQAECVVANKDCGRINIHEDSQAFHVPIPGFVPTWVINLDPLRDVKEGICDASSPAEQIYTMDLSSDKSHVRSICCRRDGTSAPANGDSDLRCFSENE